MTTEEREQMNSLCIRIQEEKDYDMFVTLMRDLENLAERKELRFERLSNGGEPENHRARLMKKLRVDSLSGLVRYAVRNSIIKP